LKIITRIVSVRYFAICTISTSYEAMNIVKNTSNTKMKNVTILMIITMTALLPTATNSLAEPLSRSCSSQTCRACLMSCDGCDHCGLCSICPENLGICKRCKFCRNGTKACKKSCLAGKKEPACNKCIENCS